MMTKIKKIFRSQTVLAVSAIFAVLSMFAVKPSTDYITYINFSTLILLFCLMSAVAGFGDIGIFTKASSFLTSKCHSARVLTFVLMNICFFSSMLITNDVALITFVPVTTALFTSAGINKKNNLIFAVIIENAAANLGSMITPIGNPHNIFLCSEYELSFGVFLKVLLPYGIVSWILLALMCFMISDEKIEKFEVNGNSSLPKLKTAIYSAVFMICIFTVSGFINEYICLAVCIILILFADFRMFAKVDYALLITFVCFFVFSGNIGNIEQVRTFLSSVIQGNEIVSSVLTSQVISNVPAAVLLSGFTSEAEKMLVGINLGAIGTPVASLAALISYKYYMVSENAKGGRFMKWLCILNFAILGILFTMAMIL